MNEDLGGGNKGWTAGRLCGREGLLAAHFADCLPVILVSVAVGLLLAAVVHVIAFVRTRMLVHALQPPTTCS